MIQESASEVSSVALGFDGCRTTPASGQIAHGLSGSYLALVGPAGSLQVGLMSREEDCRHLARALLGIAEGEDDPEPSDLRDAVCEIVNLLGGGLKRRLPEGSSFQLGLPLFVEGAVRPPEHVEVLAANLELGPARAVLFVFSEKLELSQPSVASGTTPARPPPAAP